VKVIVVPACDLWWLEWDVKKQTGTTGSTAGTLNWETTVGSCRKFVTDLAAVARAARYNIRQELAVIAAARKE